MTTRAERRGGAPVGYLEDIGTVEANAVMYMRLWCSGPEAQAAVWKDFAEAFGGREGAEHMRSFEALMTMLVQHARRPLMRHSVSCRCLGADECAFAHLVGAAMDGDLEQAAMMAALIVRPDAATTIAYQTEKVGISLAQITRRDSMVSLDTEKATHAATCVRH
ncbi:MAG: hypothetical protein AAF899_13625 [Pseudomonadota bacterium]